MRSSFGVRSGEGQIVCFTFFFSFNCSLTSAVRTTTLSAGRGRERLLLLSRGRS